MIETQKQNLSLKGKKILVVEDEALIAMKIEMMITDAGGEVIGPCATYKSAERMVDEAEFDAAIFDVRLGSQDVYPIAKRVFDKGTKFLFYSAHAELAEINDLFPGIQLISKPAQQSALISGLVKCLGSATL